MQVHTHVTLGVVRALRPNAFPFVPSHKKLMTWTPSATRADVVRMVARYVQIEFSIRSSAGRLIVDDSRLARKRGTDIDIASLSDIEILDAIKNGIIHRAVFAPPEKRRDVKYANGGTMRCVAPRREVSSIVRSKPSRSYKSSGEDAREWRATVAQKLARLTPEQSSALLGAEHLRLDLRITRNQLAAARSEHGRLRGGGREARDLREHAEIRVSELRSHEASGGEELKRLTRTAAYRDGLDELLAICTDSEDVEAYCFAERH